MKKDIGGVIIFLAGGGKEEKKFGFSSEKKSPKH